MNCVALGESTIFQCLHAEQVNDGRAGNYDIWRQLKINLQYLLCDITFEARCLLLIQCKGFDSFVFCQ